MSSLRAEIFAIMSMKYLALPLSNGEKYGVI